MDRNEDKKKVEELKHGEEAYIHWFEEGGGMVCKVWDVFVLFECAPYGGIPQYEATYRENQIDDLLDKAYSWT